MTGKEPENDKTNVNSDLSEITSKLQTEFLPELVTMHERIEKIQVIRNEIPKVFEETTDSIRQSAMALMDSIRTQETELISELTRRHEHHSTRLLSGHHQISARIEAIIRLADSSETPTSAAMDWTLPTKDELDCQLTTRIQDLAQLVDKVYEENCMITAYRSGHFPPKLGTLEWCSLRQYRSGSEGMQQEKYPDNMGDKRMDSEQVEHQKPHSNHKHQVSITSGDLMSKQFQPVYNPESTSDVNHRHVAISGPIRMVQNEKNEAEKKITSSISRDRQSRSPKTRDSCDPERTTPSKVSAHKRKKTILRSLSAHTRNTSHVRSIQRQSEAQHLSIRQRLLYKLDKLGSSFGELKQPRDVIVLPNDNIIIADYENRRLQEFDARRQPVRMFNRPKIKPKAVALTRDKFIVVLDACDHNIKSYTQGAELICRFGSGYFHDPCALAINSRDHYVIIDSHLSHVKKVFIYDPMTGIQTRIGFHDNQYLFSNPEGTAISQDDGIIITDAGHHSLLFFSKDGKFIKKVGHQGQGPGEFWYPKGITVDRNDNILVADCGNHRVCLLDNNGRYLCDVLNRHHGLHFPINIAINNNKILALVQNAEVYVFHLHHSATLSFDSELDQMPKKNTDSQRSSELSLINYKRDDDLSKLESCLLRDGLLI
ncbi:hypothetical protein LSH36_781g01014 [Paralvinella palmiformis]|uniref:Uncharacterized protein n=1 Tax=Paralvinella palmiformis TaxID=53620 RepID=A0AAD9J139_9ANNE|nr:hypothetical protein LSH36_781g01014 [Paralvinella palmiformis]